MTPEQIHDALNLLPADLIAEADRCRSGKRPKILPWKRYAAMAASVVLVLGCFAAVQSKVGMGGAAKTESIAISQQETPTQAAKNGAAEAPAAAYDQAEEAPAEEAEPQDTLCGLPTAPAAGSSISADHAHGPAETGENREPAAVCGIIADVTVSCSGEIRTLSGDSARELTWLLHSLEYKEEALCRCTAPYRVDTELGTGYEISLDQYFVRIAGTQAALTEDQAQALTRLLGD